MRSDARKHRDALVQAAARLFTRHGLDVPLQSVVDEAGVGRATLYRHFQDREALIAAVIAHLYGEMEEEFGQWRGSPNMLRHVVRLAANISPSFADVPDTIDMARVTQIAAESRRKFHWLQNAVVEAAIASNAVGPDFDIADIEMVIRMVAAASDDPARSREAAIERALDIVLAGLAAQSCQ